MIDAGKMNRLISIEQPITSKNNYGEPVTTWAKIADVWAKREDKSGLEDQEGAQLVAQAKVIWTMYYINGLHERMRVKDENGALYDINFIQEIGYKEGLAITTEKKDSYAT